jgi:hypothetical protein
MPHGFLLPDKIPVRNEQRSSSRFPNGTYGARRETIGVRCRISSGWVVQNRWQAFMELWNCLFAPIIHWERRSSLDFTQLLEFQLGIVANCIAARLRIGGVGIQEFERLLSVLPRQFFLASRQIDVG